MIRIITSLFLFIPIVSYAQITNYVIDETFNSELVFNRGGISDIIVKPDNHIMVIGQFDGIGSPVESSAQLYPNGDLEVNIGIGGQFITPYLSAFLQYGWAIRRFNVQFENFNFNFEYQKSAYNGFLGNDALDALVLPDNSILVAGRFFTDSVNHNNIESLRQLCRIDSTGAPDPDFPMLHCASPIDAKIHSMDTLSDGSLIVAGIFDELGGYPYNLVGKLNPDFSVDTTFVNSFETGCTAYVEYIDSQNRIYVRMSSLTSSCLMNAPNDSIRFVRLLPNGEVDPDFNMPIINGFHPEFGDYIGTVVDVLEFPDGRFLFLSGPGFVNGLATKGLILCEDDGTVIQESSFTNWGPDDATWGTFSDLQSASVARLFPDGKILLGGSFSSFGGEPYNCLVRLKPDGFVGIDKKEGRDKLKLYPNPAESFVTIELPQSNDVIHTVEILTIQGKLVKQVQNFKQADKLSIAGLVAGIYIVTARTDAGVFTQKLVVE